MESFENQEILLENLPRYEEVSLQGLEKNHLYSSVVSNAIFLLILLGAATSLPFIFNELDPFALYFLLLWFIIAALSNTLVILGFKYKGYALRERDILYREGLIFRSMAVVPFNRVQHAEVNQGPIERMLRLSTLHIFTAGGSSSDLSISGLTPERAHQLRDFIILKTTMSDEEE